MSPIDVACEFPVEILFSGIYLQYLLYWFLLGSHLLIVWVIPVKCLGLASELGVEAFRVLQTRLILVRNS